MNLIKMPVTQSTLFLLVPATNPPRLDVSPTSIGSQDTSHDLSSLSNCTRAFWCSFMIAATDGVNTFVGLLNNVWSVTGIDKHLE